MDGRTDTLLSHSVARVTRWKVKVTVAIIIWY